MLIELHTKPSVSGAYWLAILVSVALCVTAFAFRPEDNCGSHLFCTEAHRIKQHLKLQLLATHGTFKLGEYKAPTTAVAYELSAASTEIPCGSFSSFLPGSIRFLPNADLHLQLLIDFRALTTWPWHLNSVFLVPLNKYGNYHYFFTHSLPILIIYRNFILQHCDSIAFGDSEIDSRFYAAPVRRWIEYIGLGNITITSVSGEKRPFLFHIPVANHFNARSLKFRVCGPMYHPKIFSVLHANLALHMSRQNKIVLLRRSSSNASGFTRAAYDTANVIPRQIANLPDVVANIVNLVIFHPEAHTIRDTQELMSETAVLTGMHGAAFTNMVLCRRSTRVVEMHPGSTNYWFYAMATGLGMPYSGLLIKNASFSSPAVLSASEIETLSCLTNVTASQDRCRIQGRESATFISRPSATAFK